MKNMKPALKIIVVTLLVVIAILLFALGFLFGKYLKEGQKKEPTDQKETVAEKLKEEEKALLLDRIETVYNKYFAKAYPISEPSTLKNDLILKFAITKALNDGKALPLSSTLIDNYITTYFGKGVKANHEDIACQYDSLALYSYNSDTKTYDFNPSHPGHGGEGGIFDIKTLYLSGTQKDDIYTLNVKLAFGVYCGDTCGPANAYFKTYEDSKDNKNPVYGDPTSDEEVDLSKERFEELKDEFTTYTFTFKRDDVGYALTAVSKDSN